MKAAHSTRSSDLLNQLLQCEISAIETYSSALKRLMDSSLAAELQRYLDEHRNSAELLRRRILEMGGTPVENSGVWGKWPQAVLSTERVIGLVAELDALVGEEEHTLLRYREALREPPLDSETKKLIQEVLVPRTSAHQTRMTELLTTED